MNALVAEVLSRDDCGHTSRYRCPRCGCEARLYFSQRHHYNQIVGTPCDGCMAQLTIPQVECKYPRRDTNAGV